jgi:hypothetical protein
MMHLINCSSFGFGPADSAIDQFPEKRRARNKLEKSLNGRVPEIVHQNGGLDAPFIKSPSLRYSAPRIAG